MPLVTSPEFPVPKVPGFDFDKPSGLIRYALAAIQHFEAKPWFRYAEVHSEPVRISIPAGTYVYASVAGAALLHIAGADTFDDPYWANKPYTEEWGDELEDPFVQLADRAGTSPIWMLQFIRALSPLDRQVTVLDQATPAVHVLDAMTATLRIPRPPKGAIPDWWRVPCYSIDQSAFKDYFGGLADHLETIGY